MPYAPQYRAASSPTPSYYNAYAYPVAKPAYAPSVADDYDSPCAGDEYTYAPLVYTHSAAAPSKTYGAPHYASGYSSTQTVYSTSTVYADDYSTATPACSPSASYSSSSQAYASSSSEAPAPYSSEESTKPACSKSVLHFTATIHIDAVQDDAEEDDCTTSSSACKSSAPVYQTSTPPYAIAAPVYVSAAPAKKPGFYSLNYLFVGNAPSKVTAVAADESDSEDEHIVYQSISRASKHSGKSSS